VEEASRQLGCAVRTVWRDLGVLQEAGFPIYDEREGRRGLWKVERGFRDRLTIPLSLPEVVALLASRDMLDHGGTGPFGPAVASAFAKIQALLTPRALELVERMRKSVGSRAVGAKLQLGAGEHLEEIHRALARSGPRGPSTTRTGSASPPPDPPPGPRSHAISAPAGSLSTEGLRGDLHGRCGRRLRLRRDPCLRASPVWHDSRDDRLPGAVLRRPVPGDVGDTARCVARRARERP